MRCLNAKYSFPLTKTLRAELLFFAFLRCVFDARIFRSSLEPCTDRPVAGPPVWGDLSQAVPLTLQLQRHHATFFACFLTFAHRFFAAFTIAALPAADKTRFSTPTTSRSAEPPNAFAAARTPLSW